mgnify:FL=1
MSSAPLHHPKRKDFSSNNKVSSHKFQEFFLTPTRPKGDYDHRGRFWRLSFHMQERQIVFNRYKMKPAFRVLKVSATIREKKKLLNFCSGYVIILTTRFAATLLKRYFCGNCVKIIQFWIRIRLICGKLLSVILWFT